MMCRSCFSAKLREFTAEINIHFPGIKGLAKPSVWAFPHLSICLHCGFAEFAIPDAQLRELRDEEFQALKEGAAA